ncbi:MAG: SAM-dependent methyltransferase, partial [Hyphomicrobiales bacterium]
MASLERMLRKDLEKTVKAARRVAEAGARKAIEQLGVGEAEAPKHLTTEQRALRNRLRAHGRQLGDRRDPKGVQATTRLVQECAYEHWHRMLFARFLAETDLLIEPDLGVAITLDEVRELAREKATDWLPLASDYAERMLPQIFRKDDPVLDIALPPETRSEMEDLLKGLTKPVFEADDSLGWVYQFWQSDRKDEVNKSEVKIGADELPAVTQLFTEDYMVLFLLHNTLGAWWAGKVLAGNPSLAASAPNEAALRAACKVGDIDWTYLRFVRDAADDGTEGPWRPASGAFEGWPKAAKDVTVLDPCMGSGHFLVFALPILVAFRMAEEGLSQSAAVDAVLKDNLFGLEIDPRCTQIAAFNLAFAAWRTVGYRPLPQLNLACSGLAIGVTKAEWLKLAEKAVTAADPAAKRDLLGVEQNLLTVGLEARVKNGLEALYDLFAKAPWVGSLIDPRSAGADIFREGFDKLEPLLSSILAATDTEDAREIAVAAQGLAKAAHLLSKQYALVATNVPYLGREGHSDELASHAQRFAPRAAADLATLFLARCRLLLGDTGACAVVSPQNWWVGTAYRDFRDDILKSTRWLNACVLGEEAWYTYGNRGPNTVLIILNYDYQARWNFSAIDVSTKPGSSVIGLDMKSAALSGRRTETINGDISIVKRVHQDSLRKNREFRISIADAGKSRRLAEYVRSGEGSSTGDNDRFLRSYWELKRDKDWILYCGPGFRDDYWCDTSKIVYWQQGSGELAISPQARIQNTEMWKSEGILVGRVRGITATLFSGGCFSKGAVLVAPNNDDDFAALMSFLKSDEYEGLVRNLDPRVSAATSVLTDVPFDREKWLRVAAEKYPNGLQRPRNPDITQSAFEGRVEVCLQPLQAAVAALSGCNWKEISLLAPPALHDSVVEKLIVHGDDDGIVCVNALKGEAPAEQRLNALLTDAFGADWSAAKLAGLLVEAGFAGKSLDDWLRDGFFAQHCELFHQRPFIWHIWDGRRDGFHALVNYHRLAAPNGEGRRTLEKLIYSFLGDWIDRQRADQKAGVEGADARLAHAEHLKAELIKILEGEPPYDIFVRWKRLHEQPIGWDPDINDGVRMNIRPFMAARTLNARRANACILRAMPKIKWDKDRGKEPNLDKADYPWFWGWDQTTEDFVGGTTFDGNRWNDL